MTDKIVSSHLRAFSPESAKAGGEYVDSVHLYTSTQTQGKQGQGQPSSRKVGAKQSLLKSNITSPQVLKLYGSAKKNKNAKLDKVVINLQSGLRPKRSNQKSIGYFSQISIP